MLTVACGGRVGTHGGHCLNAETFERLKKHGADLNAQIPEYPGAITPTLNENYKPYVPCSRSRLCVCVGLLCPLSVCECPTDGMNDGNHRTPLRVNSNPLRRRYRRIRWLSQQKMAYQQQLEVSVGISLAHVLALRYVCVLSCHQPDWVCTRVLCWTDCLVCFLTWPVCDIAEATEARPSRSLRRRVVT